MPGEPLGQEQPVRRVPAVGSRADDQRLCGEGPSFDLVRSRQRHRTRETGFGEQALGVLRRTYVLHLDRRPTDLDHHLPPVRLLQEGRTLALGGPGLIIIGVVLAIMVVVVVVIVLAVLVAAERRR